MPEDRVLDHMKIALTQDLTAFPGDGRRGCHHGNGDLFPLAIDGQIGVAVRSLVADGLFAQRLLGIGKARLVLAHDLGDRKPLFRRHHDGLADVVEVARLRFDSLVRRFRYLAREASSAASII